jgi:uncharacterized membrane protein YeiH
MDSFLPAIEVLAILAFAYSGVIEARKSRFDYVGVLSVAVVTAFGVVRCGTSCSIDIPLA